MTPLDHILFAGVQIDKQQRELNDIIKRVSKDRTNSHIDLAAREQQVDGLIHTP